MKLKKKLNVFQALCFETIKFFTYLKTITKDWKRKELLYWLKWLHSTMPQINTTFTSSTFRTPAHRHGISSPDSIISRALLQWTFCILNINGAAPDRINAITYPLSPEVHTVRSIVSTYKSNTVNLNRRESSNHR